MIKVGSKTHSFCPSIPNYINVIVTVKSDSKWYPLGPYYLKNDKGHIFENIWQFHKVYQSVKEAKSGYAQAVRGDIVWTHPYEEHVNVSGEILPDYFHWREKGLTNPRAVRWPQWHIDREYKCYSSQTAPLYSFYNGEKLGYIEARKKIYFDQYSKLVKNHPLFQELLELFKSGQNILLIEWDGPQQRSLPYYQSKYQVEKDFIINSTIDATKRNLEIMMNDPKHPFGHGYCLAAILQGITFD